MAIGILTTNCADKRMVETSVIYEIPDVYYDERHQIFSENNTNDTTEYLNYIDLIRDIAQKDNTTGKYRYMLDLGFIPVSMPPTWMLDSVYSGVRAALEAKGIEYFQLPASSFSLGNYTVGAPDIWVSKITLAPICNCKPELVTVRKILGVLGL